jgi:hypothetical protein
MPPRNPDPPGRNQLSNRPFEWSSLTRSQTLDGQVAAATHKRNDKMPGRNCEFDSSAADETATAGYQDGMSLGGHIGNILFRLPQQGSLAPRFTTAKKRALSH